MTTAIQTRTNTALSSSATNLLNLSLQDTLQLGAVLARSGYFKDTRDEAQAVAKILYGRELGIGPMAAMMGIHIIEGKPAPSANLIATLIQRSGRFAYRVREWDERICRIEFFEQGESVGIASFSIQEAQQAKVAGKDNWSKYPKAMLFSRTISQGARAYCPAVFGGAPVYTPDELGADITVDATTGEIQVMPAELPPGPRVVAQETPQRREPPSSTLSAADAATIRSTVAALGWSAKDCEGYLRQYGVARFGELTADQAAEVGPYLLSNAAEIDAA
jgi:hypothetical protein